jgi:hypothetical protein
MTGHLSSRTLDKNKSKEEREDSKIKRTNKKPPFLIKFH